MQVKIEESWRRALTDEFRKPYFEKLTKKVRGEYTSQKIYPPPALIFNAFNLCPFDSVRVVILGQDPYHGAGQAHGLSFSVPDGTAIPPSLQNIYKEIRDDLGLPIPKTGNLEHWAKEGVLLLNATLTVRAGSPASHSDIGWEKFTDAVIKTLSEKKERLVFLLWGRFAQDKASLIDLKKHLVLTAAHPSPFSAYNGFFRCKHFSKTNEYLISIGENPINWASKE